MSSETSSKKDLVLPSVCKINKLLISDSIIPDGKHLIIGGRNSGKTTLALELLNQFSTDVTVAVLTSLPEKYRSITPNVFTNVTTELVNYFENASEKIVLIIDDFIELQKHDINLNRIFDCDITIIICAQYQINICYRPCIDRVFVTNSGSNVHNQGHTQSIWASFFAFVSSARIIECALNELDRYTWLTHNDSKLCYLKSSITTPRMYPTKFSINISDSVDTKLQLIQHRDELNAQISNLINLRAKLDKLIDRF